MSNVKKQYIILKVLFEHKFDGKYYSLKTILDGNSMLVSYHEASEIGNHLKKKGFIKLVRSKDSVDASITGEGCEHIESLKNRIDYLSDDTSSPFEKKVIVDGIDELIERLKKLEIGQEMIYDDLYSELEEIKNIVDKIPKKNIKNQIIGALVQSGLGQLSDGAIEALSSPSKFLD